MNYLTVTFKLGCKSSLKFEKFLKKNEYDFEVADIKEWFGDNSKYVTWFEVEYTDDNSKQRIIDILQTLNNVIEIKIHFLEFVKCN